jgi:hypothetical protein
MKKLPVVRTGNVALDRFLDGVRLYVEQNESADRVLRVSDIPRITGSSGGVSVSGSMGGLPATSPSALKAEDLEYLAQEILNTKLFKNLTSKIEQAAVPTAANTRRVRELADEAAIRSIEMTEKTLALADDIAVEAQTRLDQVQDAAETALQALTDTHNERTDRIIAVANTETILRGEIELGDDAEATQRGVLAAQIRGDYTGNDINALSTGLIYDERTARVSSDNALAQQITLLSAGAGEQFDWAEIWYFDAGIEGWTGI